ncbi:MAG: substrate-binding domain-containing protein [Desulfopila sp.]|jgi:tungstate transport system substrate-binding protein|nr:substrate-binding domain-containing protein [Desulfopila sp.]
MKKRIMMLMVAAVFMVCSAQAEEKVLTMSTTTSTLSSGLLDILLPQFQKETGIEVKVIAKGTGAAIRDGMDGNVDIIFVHARGREEQFVAEGYGTERYAVMHNDFVLIGPPADPAGIKGMTNGAAALTKIAEAKAPFISRGDDSGTHTKEQSLWKATGLKVASQTQTLMKGGKKVEISATVPENSADWYFSIGQGMGKTLTYADEKQAYTLTDRGTYIKYKYGKTPAIDLEIVCEKDEALANPYGIIPVNPKKHGHVKIDLAEKFVAWITSVEGQKLINDYRLEGKQLFFPDAVDAGLL